MPAVTSPGVLAGRTDELALLGRHLRGLAGGGGALLIEGEPGIGKTTLVRAALASLPSGSCQVFWGAGDELGQELPLSPFLDALGVRQPSASARRNTIAGLLRGEVPTDRGADVPAILSEQLIALAAEECAARPAVIVIDDLHWADPASVRLWARVARAAGHLPLLLIGLMRPAPHRDDLLALRRAVDEEARIQLAGLTPEATEDLVAEMAGGRPERDLLKLAIAAGGNPLYVTELIAALARSGGVTITETGQAGLAGDALPRSLSAAIAARLGFVSTPTTTVLRAAALLGVEFAISDLTAILGRPVADLVPAIDEAMSAGVLAEFPGGLAFRHPLIRAAIYEGMPAQVRAVWHRDAGRALAAADAPADRVARQLLRSAGRAAASAEDAQSGTGADDRIGRAEAPRGYGGADGRDRLSAAPALIGFERPPVDLGEMRPVPAGPMDKWALDWLTVSADSLLGQAPGVAAELLAQAVAEMPTRSHRHGWLTSRLADALYRTGDWEAAAQVAERALAHATDPDMVVDLHWTLAQCKMQAGSAAESLATLDRALASPELSAKHRARLLVLAARTNLLLGDVEAAGREAAGALASAGGAGDAWATAWALHVLALETTVRGNMVESLPLYARALAVTETDPMLTDLGLLLLVNKSLTLGNLNRYDEALTTAERARQLADQFGTTLRLTQAHGALGQVFYETGRWDDALAEIEAMPADLKEPRAACGELGAAAVISFHRNESGAARELLAATEPHAARAGQAPVTAPLVLARSLDRERAGDLPGALAVLTAAFDGGADDLGEIEDLLGDCVRLAVMTGDKATARALAGQADALAEGSQVPARRANALYCRGLLGRDAITLLSAAQAYADAGRPLLRAAALEAAADGLAETGDMTRARDAFTQAVGVYEALRAEADVHRVLAGFRKYGIRRGPRARHREARSGWESLTGTELKVAALVEQGLSNPEIARRLVLSPRTIGTHVSHILQKLGVASRSEIARESAVRSAAVRSAAASRDLAAARPRLAG